MTHNNKLYPNGFLLSAKEETNIPNYYQYKLLNNKYHLYYDPIYDINYYQDDNTFIYIHGHFKHSSYNENSLSNEELLPYLLKLFNNNYEEYLNLLDFIGGRYCILIGDDKNLEVYQDATGARSVYYTTNNEIISSHVYLISDIIECQLDRYSKHAAYAKVSFDNTPYENIKSLLPNFKLNFNSKSITRFFPRENNKYSSINEEEKIRIVEHLWKEQLEYYYEKYKNILVSITGGIDSRISLALSKKYINDLKFFTYSKNPENVNSNNLRESSHDKDRIIVEQILSDIEMNHRFIYYNDDDLVLPENFIYQLSKNSVISHARYLLNLYNLNFKEHKYMHLRGTCLEIVKSVYLTEDINSAGNRSVKELYLNLAKKQFKNLSKDDFNRLAGKSISKLGYAENHYDFAVQDLFYWEHRMGRWHPELLNETDLSFDTFLPFNLRSILEIGLSFSFEKRKSDFLFKELINKNYPVLNFYGINNLKNIYEQQNKQIHLPKLKPHITKTPFNSMFYIYNKTKNEYTSQQLIGNKLILPKDYLYPGNFVSVDYKIESQLANVEFSLLSKYEKVYAENALSYEVILNNNRILSEDISKWNAPNHINIFNLKEGDIITLKVVAHKALYYKSWEIASELLIEYFREYPLSWDNRKKPKITATSPYSQLH